MPNVQGFSHLALSVTDSAQSSKFYSELLGGQVIDASDAISPFHVVVAGTVVLGFRAHPGIVDGDAFDHNRVGMDHVALAVSDRAELEAWLARLNEMGVTNSGIGEDPGGLHLNARDPDNIPIEFYAPAG